MKNIALLFVCVFVPLLLLGQTPNAVARYKSTSSNTFSSNARCEYDTASLDRFFYIMSGKEPDINREEIDSQIVNWTVPLNNIEVNVNASRACIDAAIISGLKERIKRVQENRTIVAVAGISSNKTALEFEAYVRSVVNTLDSLYSVYRGINKIYGRPKAKNLFIPSTNRIKAEMIYRKYKGRAFQVGSNIVLYGSENRAAVNPELVSFFIGPVKAAVNTLVSTTADTNLSIETQFRTLTGNGGNAVFSLYFPIFHHISKRTWTFLELSPKGVFEVPILNSPFDPKELYGNINLGIDLNFSTKTELFGSSFYMYCRAAYIIGSLPYLRALDVRGNFGLLQYTFGLDIPSLGRIGLLPPVLSSESSFGGNTWQLSFQVSPQNIIR